MLRDQFNRLSRTNHVFSEPQFTPAVVQSVMRGSDVAKGELDPLGSTIEAKPGELVKSPNHQRRSAGFFGTTPSFS